MRLDLSTFSPEQFEDLIEAIFRAQMPSPVTSVERTGRGADQGMDLMVKTLVSDCVTYREIRWLVQCKHNAKSKRSVQAEDFSRDFSFPDMLSHHNASDFLLVCSTRPSTNLQAQFMKLTKDKHPHQFLIWDHARVCDEILKQDSVLKQFFPEVYRYQQGLVDSKHIKQWADEHRLTKTAKKALNDLLTSDAPIITSEAEQR